MDILGYCRRLKFGLYRVLSLILYNLSNYTSKNNHLLNKLKGIHTGQRAFIICNGPSLSPADLDKIEENGDLSFACNKIENILSTTIWRPTYYAVFDETYQYTLLNVINLIPAKLKFFRKSSYYVTRKATGVKAFVNADGGKKLLDNCKFSEDVSNVIYTVATTTYALFQLAVHMGIRELYIIGCDNSYAREISKDGTIRQTGRKSYFSAADKKEQSTAASVWQMNLAYEYARKYADIHGIKIYNATRGGYLEAFERIDFDSLFLKKNDNNSDSFCI